MITKVDVLNDLKYLSLNSAYDKLNELNDMSQENLEFIHKIIHEQVLNKELNYKLYNIKTAAFPFIKELDDFDFSFQQSINETQIRNLANSNFYDKAINIVFLGSPGVGKTHLSISIGINVALKRNSVYFIKFSKLIDALSTADEEGKLEKRLKVYNKYKLLIIDEIGFNELSYREAKLFFQLVDIRYEKRSTIFTSNIPFDKWGNILGKDEMITRAILDRILHHSKLFNIEGASYRLKDKVK